jgi:haloacetate dehalogenase
MAAAPDPLFPDFEVRRVELVGGIEIACVIGGSGPPMLLLHGHPQTRAIWHRVAPVLVQRFTVIAADLRGYGDSSRPRASASHAEYSKRVMAQDQLALMKALGYERFDILAHDRGARVGHRLAVDHPQAVNRMMLLDIAPTLAMYEQTTEAFARAYWHWFFLIQPPPLPERLIEADPGAYVRDIIGSRGAGLAPFHPLALAEYERCASLPGSAHAMCEDYRAAASIDLDHDRIDRDRGHRLQMPLRVLWGEHGVVHRCFDPLREWQRLADQVSGGPLPCGHYIAEEAADALLAEALAVFG